MKFYTKTSLLLCVLLVGCSTQVTQQPKYLDNKQEQWKAEILQKCFDKAHELTYLVWQENKFLDIEQLEWVEKRFQDKCVVQNNLSI